MLEQEQLSQKPSTSNGQLLALDDSLNIKARFSNLKVINKSIRARGLTEVKLTLAISMENKKQTGEYLQHFIDLVNRTNTGDDSGSKARKKISGFKIAQVIFLLSDYLQRHYIKKTPAKELGRQWMQKNTAYLSKLNTPFKISYWSKCLKSTEYFAEYKKVIALYKINDGFKNTVHSVAKSHTSKGSQDAAIKYLLEECAVFLLLKDSYVAYPSDNLNAATKCVVEYFKTGIQYVSYAFYTPKLKIENHTTVINCKQKDSSDIPKSITQKAQELISELDSCGIKTIQQQTKFFKKIANEIANGLKDGRISQMSDLNDAGGYVFFKPENILSSCQQPSFLSRLPIAE